MRECENELLWCFLAKKVSFYNYFRETKASRQVGEWQQETSISYSCMVSGNMKPLSNYSWGCSSTT